MITLFIFTLLLIIYSFIIKPWQLKGGSTTNEVNFALPGDKLVKNPDFNATRGINISSTPEEVWKWIIQIGSKRAGWHSIDWIDNGGIKSSIEILPEFQKIETGQFIPFTPDQKNGMWVKDFKIYRYILWTNNKGKATWLWYLNINDNGITRLITRLKTKYVWNSIWIVYYLIFDFGDIVMMKKCMKGIKKRAENARRQNSR